MSCIMRDILCATNSNITLFQRLPHFKEIDYKLYMMDGQEV